MNDLSLQELKSIRDNAPHGTDYVTDEIKYISVCSGGVRFFNELGVWSSLLENASDIFIEHKPSKLSDINKLIDLMSKPERQGMKYAK